MRSKVSKTQCEVEILVRGAHDQIIAGLMKLNVDQLHVERLLEMAIELHENAES
jgi:hypothetical protein